MNIKLKLFLTIIIIGNHSLAIAQDFQGLGALPVGFENAFAKGISDNGSVVVGVSRSSAGLQAFRWSSSTGIQGIGDLPGGTFYSDAYAVSSNGSVIVGFGNGNSSIGEEAFRWTESTGMQGLGGFSTETFRSKAFGISANGSVIVGSGNATVGREAFRWDATSGMQGLGQIEAGSTSSSATDISDDSTVIVGTASTTQGNTAFLWTESTGMQALGDLAGGNFSSQATGVSADGNVVIGGGTSLTTGSEAFRWDAVNGMQGLGFLTPSVGADYLATISNGTTADGSIIVGDFTWSNTHHAFGNEAFIWDENNGMQNLSDYLQAAGLDFTGWQLTGATAITSDGNYILGQGINPNGINEAWVANLSAVPVPPAVWLFSFGLISLVLTGRRRR